ncbi:uncharacterized protein K444DRAFT_712028 [Hyaloscypha bicolor E]|uniref:Uncharacterized protein n=1 Tax=Hyaloscypha bicolor E TaxID=1095630 RepID=A0A2J6SGR3_9HELO|nr:uncharacterized protein K444DRAFT_712028 [Hyaloscypha bicolor E]PMD49934.1 hypothetical protein K444DRAFT_712028 [Hyaloscypha bicolor E]
MARQRTREYKRDKKRRQRERQNGPQRTAKAARKDAKAASKAVKVAAKAQRKAKVTAKAAEQKRMSRANKKEALKKAKNQEMRRKAKEAFDAMQLRLFGHPARTELIIMLQGDGGLKWRTRTNNIYQGAPATCSGIKKTLRLVNGKELRGVLERDPYPGILVLVDEEWSSSLPVIAIEDMIEYCQTAGTREINIQILDLAKSTIDTKARIGQEIATYFNTLAGQIVNNPFNLLNITIPLIGIDLSPPGFSTYFPLLRDSCNILRDGKIQEIRSKQATTIVQRKTGFEDCI